MLPPRPHVCTDDLFVWGCPLWTSGRSLVGLPFSDMVAIARDAGAAQGDIAVDVIHQQTVYEVGGLHCTAAYKVVDSSSLATDLNLCAWAV